MDAVAAMYTGDVILTYGLGTYAVLLGSWLAICIPFAACDRFGWLAHYSIQPEKRQSQRELESQAFQMAGFNWAWLAAVLTLAR